MKLVTLIKLFSCGVLVAGGITAGVIFSDVNTVKFPTVRILTKENYNNIRTQQYGADRDLSKARSVTIDYLSLPGTNYSILDVLLGDKKIGNGNYMFFFGSETYLTGAKALYGWDKPYPDYSSEQPPRAVDSLLLTLYDLFFSEKNNKTLVDYGIDKVNPTFLNYVDIASTQDVHKAQELLNYRMYSLPNTYYPDGDTELKIGVSKCWKVGSDIASPKFEPVVKNVDFDYRPENTFYEFRPDNGEETKYEKVYYRDQDIVDNFNEIANIMNKYLTSISKSFDKEGTLLLAKYDNGWSFDTIKDFSDVNAGVKTVVKFYNPSISIPDDEIVPPPEDENSPPSGDGGGSGESPQQPPSRVVFKKQTSDNPTTIFKRNRFI